ncbi:MAG: ATP-binding protein [Deltaproteobacteria bacterium]|jgi:hypothetical protein|nr:ATP-binding protein [Deltaproteobacteria bacterium]
MNLLPVGVADFQTMRKRGYIYADKTEIIYTLFQIDSPYFLSRPRRFGKSLLVSTIKAILRGQRELFKGLWIDQSDYDWQPYPVIHLSLSAIRTDSVATVNDALLSKVKSTAKDEGLLSIQEPTPELFFEALIKGLHAKYGQKPAILIDEYDAPILSKITESPLAEGIRDTLKLFYSVMKDMEEFRGFTFITGVTKFAQTSIFSGLNNLVDLTLDREYANICGFTIDELDTLFQDRLEQSLEVLKKFGELDQADTVVELRNKILDWYDGYSWDGVTSVLNPWSLLSFFKRRSFNNYWFSSGAPTFLINLVKKQNLDLNYFKSDNFISDKINNIDLEKLNATALMFQSGYLTINTNVQPEGSLYNLVFPNLEIKASLLPLFLSLKNDFIKPLLMRRQALAALAFLFQRDSSGFKAAFESFLSNVPYEIHRPQEAFYHALFIAAMAMADQYFESELSVAGGRLDLHLKEPDGDDFVIEIKYRQKNQNLATMIQLAFDQIEERKYYLKFQGEGNRIWKTALVIGGAKDVTIEFEQALNWNLESVGLYQAIPMPQDVPEKIPD